jgi:gas vesicle protein
VDAQKIIDSLDQQSFEQIFEDIQKTDINDNKLSKLIGNLKELCEQKMLAYKQNEEEAHQHMENLQKEIRELQSTKEQVGELE